MPFEAKRGFVVFFSLFKFSQVFVAFGDIEVKGRISKANSSQASSQPRQAGDRRHNARR
jgi:hypothetical protein